MSILGDAKVLFHLLLHPIRGATHQQRLESFYAAQAEEYDRFRKNLLHGREELYASLPTPEDGVWVEIGGGTGSNLENLGDRIKKIRKVHIVDLSSSLLGIAKKRVERLGWTNVELNEADATTVTLPEPADVVTFSYSLTMIPDWFAALENARKLLKPGGTIGIVDFYIARKYPAEGRTKHGWWTRTFWPTWFASDNVFLSSDHIPYLHRQFTPVSLHEARARIRWFPLLTTPYYRFVGRKPEA
jgi:S-adenosylmethionine-diacylgycerolhomoserine-N-methlytransferase